MIQFHPIRIEDRARIERYTMPSGIVSCDLSFANMFCWQGVYRSAWAEVDGFLVIRFHIGGGAEVGYMQPVGAGDFTPVVEALADDARALGQRLRLAGLTEEGCAQLRRAYPGVFAFGADRAAEDYVYAADDLRRLPGRRYQPKRNHLNRFAATHPDWRYEPLTAAHADECMALERAWRRTHEGRTAELCAEQRAMQRAFDHFDALGLIGGCLYADERLVAFTYGSAVGPDTFNTHVEKADPAYVRDGAFTMINKCFAEHLPDRFTQINREEDLGLEGLRQAKLSYHPAFRLRKFTAIRLHDDERACKALWQEAFGDDEAFVDAFLVNHYRRSDMLAVEAEGQLAAMLHLVPFESELGRTTYIYGVATSPAFRGRGYASQLMEEALRRIEERGDDAALLIPSPGREHLRRFYARFGFAGEVPVAFDSADGFDFGTGDPAADLAMVRRRDPAAPLPERIGMRPAGRGR